MTELAVFGLAVAAVTILGVRFGILLARRMDRPDGDDRDRPRPDPDR